MIPTCPRCGSVDVHSSRSHGVVESIVRLAGVPPRRCSACGWRGFRPRIIFPSRHGSDPALAAVKESLQPVAPPPPPPAPAPRRHHRKHHQVKPRKGGNSFMLMLLALAIGLGAGFVAYAFAN